MRSIQLGILLGTLTGCVDEHDPEVLVVLPDIPSPCTTLEAARAHIAIDTTDGEHFEIASEICARLPGQQLSGFVLAVDRITGGHHRATIAIDSLDGELGRIERPFAPDEVLVVAFEFADLPNWPTGPLILEPACATEFELAITPSTANRPALTRTLACAPITLDAPRGPVTIEGRTTDPCTLATAFTLIDPAIPRVPLGLDFRPSECP